MCELTMAGTRPLWETFIVLGGFVLVLWFVWLRPKLLDKLVRKAK